MDNTFNLHQAQIADGYWYVGTPYARYTKGHDAAFRDAADVTAKLMGLNVRCFSPICHSHPIALTGKTPDTHDFWLNFVDLPLLRASYGMIAVMLDGWNESRGMEWEIDKCAEMGKPLFYLNPNILDAYAR